MGNYSFQTTNLPEPANGIVEGHNFTQAVPHTAIYSGYSGLTFRRCNLLNCDIPEDSILEKSQHCHVSFCSHLHPDWVAQSRIEICATDCEHLTIIDTIVVDGVTIDANNTYEDHEVD